MEDQYEQFHRVASEVAYLWLQTHHGGNLIHKSQATGKRYYLNPIGFNQAHFVSEFCHGSIRSPRTPSAAELIYHETYQRLTTPPSK
jgi:hypothetical protein